MLVLALWLVPSLASAAQADPSTTSRRSEAETRLLSLVSVRRLFFQFARRREAMGEGERVAEWTDLAVVASAVAGTALAPLSFEDVLVAAESGREPVVRLATGARARDLAADRLLALGYSAREASDVVSGRITQRALDTARQMIAVGRGREVADNYLDAQYRRIVDAAQARQAPPPLLLMQPATPFDAFIERAAAVHQVQSAVVRAIIATESAFNPLARSRAGALGLMQLMPATARELGVNPLVPEQNIEGGVRYFSQLLRMFGGLELALVAYNAGPGFAQRYARGETGLYGETRDYVRRVIGRLGTANLR